MKLHYKDWTTIAFRVSDKIPVYLPKVLASQCSKEIPEPWKKCSPRAGNSTKLISVTKGYKCFRFSGDSSEIDDYFQDMIHPILAAPKSQLYTYPIYTNSFELGESRFSLLSFPYSALAEEIMGNLRSIDYCRIRIEGLMQVMHAQLYDKNASKKSSDTKISPRAILRSGRFPLVVKKNPSVEDDKSSIEKASKESRREVDWLDSVVLVGKDVMQSTLYQRLIGGVADGQKYEFSGAVARVSFHEKGVSLVSTRIDRRGNFALRPGNMGENLVSLIDFFRFCHDQGLVDVGKFSPFDQPIEFVP